MRSLNYDDVILIRKLYKEKGITISQIGRELGFSRHTISRVTSGEYYKWVDESKPLKGEIWKPYTNIYSASSMGRIKDGIGRVIAQTNHDQGYLTVGVLINEKMMRLYVHRIVAMVFLHEQYSEGLVVNHINLKKNDNRVENLEWVTQKENIQHAIANDAWKGRSKNEK